MNFIKFHIADDFRRSKKERWHYSSGMMAVLYGTAEGVIKF